MNGAAMAGMEMSLKIMKLATCSVLSHKYGYINHAL